MMIGPVGGQNMPRPTGAAAGARPSVSAANARRGEDRIDFSSAALGELDADAVQLVRADLRAAAAAHAGLDADRARALVA